jgi:hypothetical protein
LHVKAATHETPHEGREGVDDYGGCRDCASPNVEVSKDTEDNGEEDHKDELYSGAQKPAKEWQVGGKAKDVGLDLLPAGVVVCVAKGVFLVKAAPRISEQRKNVKRDLT